MTINNILSNTARKRVLIILGAVALIALLAGAAQCTRAVNAPEDEVIEQPSEEELAQRAEEERLAALDAELGEDAAKKRSEYDSETLEFQGILTKSAWVTGSGNEVKFTEKTFAESQKDSDVIEIPYVISDIKRNRFSSSDKEIDQTIAAIQTPDGTHLLTLTYLAAQQSETWTLSSDIFQTKGDFQRAATATEFTITGDEDMRTTLAVLLGSDTSMLEDLLKDYCALYYPSASEAYWSGSADVDWVEHTVNTDFSLNNAAKTHVLVTYHSDTSSYEFG